MNEENQYRYTGPNMDIQPLLLKHGALLVSERVDFPDYAIKVKAEVNVNIATVRSVFIVSKDCWYDIEPVYIAAKYLEPIKSETIHFEQKESELTAEKLAEKIYNDVNNATEGNAGAIPYLIFKDIISKDYTPYFTPKEVREYLEKIQGQSIPRKEAEEIINGGKDNHEVGGTHYGRMAIEPWDYIYANKLDFDSGNVVKYISRHKDKNGAEDVKKAISFCKHILKTQYGEEE